MDFAKKHETSHVKINPEGLSSGCGLLLLFYYLLLSLMHFYIYMCVHIYVSLRLDTFFAIFL